MYRVRMYEAAETELYEAMQAPYKHTSKIHCLSTCLQIKYIICVIKINDFFLQKKKENFYSDKRKTTNWFRWKKINTMHRLCSIELKIHNPTHLSLKHDYQEVKIKSKRK